MEQHLQGQIYSLMAALTWAYALVLFKQSGEQVAPVALNLFKNVVGLTLLALTLALTTLLGFDDVGALRRLPPRDIGILLLSGTIGIALADTIFFHALNLIGVGLISIVDCAYAPSAILFSWILLSEKLRLPHYLGGALIVLGVFIASRHDPPPNRTRGQLVTGMVLAILAVALMAFGIVIAKPILRDCPLLWATALRMVAGSLVLALFALTGPAWKAHWSVFRPSPIWKRALPASVLGTYICMILWVAGFKYTYASIAAVLNQTSVIFASILAALILKEQFGSRKIAAAALALSGVVIVALGEYG